MANELEQRLSFLGDKLSRGQLKLAVMESCTGGLLATAISATPGCSDYFLGGIVSYATESKLRFGVPQATVSEHGVVSEQTAREMAQAVRRCFDVNIGVGVTGVAGPKEQDGMPVGCVFIAVGCGDKTDVRRFDFAGNPDVVKEKTVAAAIDLVIEQLSGDF